MDWPRERVKNLCSLIVDCVNRTAPITEQKTPYRMIRTTNVRNGRIDLSTCRYVEKDVFDRWSRRAEVREGDVILTREAPIGEVGYIQDLQNVFLGQRIMHYRPDPVKINPRYLFYAFRSPFLRHQFGSHEGSGSVVSHIRVADCHEFEVPVPPRKEQEAIAELIGVLDDKIELNRRMNETLEATARAIFKDWFVDFGPTRAKMDGHAPYLAPDLWALFPDRFDADGKPEGWFKSTIGEEVEVVGGSTPSTAERSYWNGQFCWATPKDLSDNNSSVLFNTERKISEAGLTQISSGLLPKGTVLLSSRAPIGYLAIAQMPTAINQGFIAMKCNGRLSNILVWLWTHANMDNILKKANGSTFQEISKTNFRPISVTMGPPNVLGAFEQLATPLWSKLVDNTSEIQGLVAIRDLLLPKLMSGEIRLRDAQKRVEAVA